jgi:hypothetical protein
VSVSSLMPLVRRRSVVPVSVFLPAVAALCASQPWDNKDPSQWTATEVQRILTGSPWAQQAMASFGKPLEPEDMPVTPPLGPQGGMSGSRGASDGRWDGGIARNTGVGEVPSLPITVRWDSALPVRAALSRSKDERAAAAAERAAKDYVITVIGLVPADNPVSAEHPANDPAQIQGFLVNSKLEPRGQRPIAPEDAAIDSATGAVHLFFPRTHAITLTDKELTFVTRFGSVTVQKRFRLKDMMYKGQLEL